ncbi:recombinase family protein [uncultured Sphaerochaeta sp.]|uniref:recombinase family protein n=1 Tax=uncultured Sphaerochaeta sp. TaxID=886478 RepID=UPI002A0A6E20|nr:recombinase family protein [uncultured Sphaerochaeta sp.]
MDNSKAERTPKIGSMAKVTRVNHGTPALPSRKRVAAYARVSVDSEELMASLAAQISHYSTYIQSNHSWEYAGVYADAGISGTGTKNRAEFKRLIADCEKGLVDIILTKSVSRFARNTVDLLDNVRKLRGLNVSVRFEREHLDSFSPDGELMLSILASYAQEESHSISENVKWGIRKRFEQGEFPAYNMYGYRWTGDRFEIVESEAEAVRFMYRAFAGGRTLIEISKALAAMGILNRIGNPFGKSSILRILDQEKYRGFSILQRTFIESHITHRKKMNNGELPRFVVDGTHPRIIDDDLHEKVEAERERRRRINVVRWSSASCFTAKLVCGSCRHTFTYTPAVSSAGVITEFQQGQYRCSNKRINTAKACSAKNLPLRSLRQTCCTVLGPLASATSDAGFDPAWVETLVDHIVVFGDHLEFHLKEGRVISSSWKSTARKDAWVLRKEKLARAKAAGQEEVQA